MFLGESKGKIGKKRAKVNNVFVCFRTRCSEATEAAVRRCSLKLVFLKVSQCSQENTCVGIFFNKVAGLKSYYVIKNETPTRVFFCEYCEIYGE